MERILDVTVESYSIKIKKSDHKDRFERVPQAGVEAEFCSFSYKNV